MTAICSVPYGKPGAGKSDKQFDERKMASAKPRRRSLLCKWGSGLRLAAALAFGAAGAKAGTTNIVYNGVIGYDEWCEVGICPSFDLIQLPIVARGDGGMFVSDNITSHFVRVENNYLYAQFQVKTDWCKCVALKFKIENGKLYVIKNYATYSDKNDYPRDYGISNGSRFDYGVNRVTATVPDFAEAILVSGAPEEYGTPSPDYGYNYGMVSGTVYSLSAPAAWTSESDDKAATSSGWKLYKLNDNGTWDSWREGNGNTVADYEHPGVFTKIEWQWTENFKCTAVASGQGGVDKTSEWHVRGDTFTVTATPSNGWVFACWTGDVPKSRVVDNPLALEVSDSLNVTSVFVVAGSVAYWTGAGDNALASNPANWLGGVQPFHMQTIDFTAEGTDKPMTWDLEIAPGGWVQTNYNSVVTFNTVYPDAGLGDFTTLRINGDVNLQSGSWTHLVNKTGQFYRLNVHVTGNMTIGPNALINADGLGYWLEHAVNGKYTTPGNSAGSHGGHGGFGQAPAMSYTFGSYCEPEDLGNGSPWGGTVYPAGGAVKLRIGGMFTHHGEIRANSLVSPDPGRTAYYSASGGSVYVIAGEIEGTGKLKADAYGNTKCGGGGRVAVKLTKPGADFANWDIVAHAEAIALTRSTSAGGSGTVYGETAADTPGKGWLIMKGNGVCSTDIELNNGDPFTYETTYLNFAKLTVTNNLMILVAPGNTLDLRGTEVVATDVANRTNGIRLNGGSVLFEEGALGIDLVSCRMDCVTMPAFPGGTLKTLAFGDLRFLASGGFAYTGDVILDGGRIMMPKTFTLTGDVTVKEGGALFVDTLLDVTGNVTVEDGGLVTQKGPQQQASYKCEIHTAGNFTVAAGGKVATTGKGYACGYGYNGFVGTAAGGSHGGQGYAQNMAGDSAQKPFGSLREPITAGSGAGGSGAGAGGGVVKLVVGGTLMNNGEISSKGNDDGYYAGAGGSVNITAAEISGTGVIDVSAGLETSVGTPTQSGGGRVAIRLTGANADFSGFDLDRITAYGTFKQDAIGGAGTIYLMKGGEDLAAGTLVVRNSSQNVTQGNLRVTPVGGDVTDTEFGDVVIGKNGTFKVADNTSITVNGDWSNGAYFVAGENSTVSFAGSEISTVTGNTAFAAFSCVTPGKTIRFDPGTRQTVSTLLNLNGTTLGHIVMRSVTDGEPWELDAAGGVSLSCVDFKDCHAVTPLTVVNGTDLGGNENITFISVTPGETMTWIGAAGSNWGASGNWDRNRFPISSDVVVIPAGCAYYPVLAGDSSVGTLTFAAGASLDVAGHTLSVSGDASFAGSVNMNAAGSVAVGGDAVLGGAWSGIGAEVVLAGAGNRSVSVTSASKMPAVVLEGGEVAFDGVLRGECLTVSAGTEVQFASGTVLTLDAFTVTGTEVAPVTLSGAGTWTLDASRADVTRVAISKCDASSGVLIVADANSIDNGDNVNWMFGDTRLRWNGEAGDYSDRDAIVESGSVTLAANNAATLKSLAVAEGATLTVDGTLAVAGAVTVESGGTIAWNTPGTIGGNLTLIDGAVLTHDGGGTKRIDLTVGGAGLIQAGAMINVKGKGYPITYEPSGRVYGNWGGTHGGRSYGGDKTPWPCYGSITCPTNCGASSGNSSYGSVGGGAVKLAFAGALLMDGEINADGAYRESYYTGAGGSIWITASTMTGAGNLLASGGQTTGWSGWGGGGRISVVLTATGSDLSGFTGRIETFGGHMVPRNLAVGVERVDLRFTKTYRDADATAAARATVVVVGFTVATTDAQKRAVVRAIARGADPDGATRAGTSRLPREAPDGRDGSIMAHGAGLDADGAAAAHVCAVPAGRAGHVGCLGAAIENGRGGCGIVIEALAAGTAVRGGIPVLGSAGRSRAVKDVLARDRRDEESARVGADHAGRGDIERVQHEPDGGTRETLASGEQRSGDSRRAANPDRAATRAPAAAGCRRDVGPAGIHGHCGIVLHAKVAPDGHGWL